MPYSTQWDFQQRNEQVFGNRDGDVDGEEAEYGRVDFAAPVSSRSSGADDDDHNRDTEAGRVKKSPAPAPKE